MQFEISLEDRIRLNRWLIDEVYPVVIAEQKALLTNPSAFQRDCWEQGHPWTGAAGGGLTYQFSPTSLGMVTKVIYLDRFTLDLTDYESW